MLKNNSGAATQGDDCIYPIDHWSYSSMVLFLRNRLSFKTKYILKIYDQKRSVASVVGGAAHDALRAWYSGVPAEKAIKVGYDTLKGTSDEEIEFGKTGSREQMLKDYATAINGYIAEVPKYKVLASEVPIVTFFKRRDGGGDGEEFALPLKTVPDLVIRKKNGRLAIIDHKFVRSYSDPDTDRALLYIQAWFNFHGVAEEFGEEPEDMYFNEFKISKNKDGSPQLRPYVINFDRKDELTVFYQLYNDCTREIIKPDVLFLPNPADMLDGDDTFAKYRSNLVDVESPIVTEHKAKDLKVVERRYVPSSVSMTQNKAFKAEEKIRVKLGEFGIPVEMGKTNRGGSVVQYTFQVARGVRMTQVEKHVQDLALALEAKSIRIQAPIPGTNLVGVEVENPKRRFYRLPSDNLVPHSLVLPIGVNVYGETVHKDLAEMPHLLVAGSTGSGKSVLLNTLLTALTRQNSPDDMSLILIDPKRVELAKWKDQACTAELVSEEEDAARVLNELCELMDSRYGTLEKAGYTNVAEYNKHYRKQLKPAIVVIDEFADLMLQSNTELEDLQKLARREEVKRTGLAPTKLQKFLSPERAIIRLAQKGRSAGIHLVIATQHPTVDVVTGLIKANMPTRIAFMTTSRKGSEVILDQTGADQLIGKGDLLFLDPATKGLQRLQAFYT